MNLKDDNEIYDYDAYLDDTYGREDSAERQAFRDEARNCMLGEILKEERKKMTEIVDAIPL